MLNYATLKPNGNIVYKSESELESHEILRRELKDSIVGVVRVHDLDIWHDDEFLLKGRPEVTLVIKNRPSPQLNEFDLVLCGDLVFASSDKIGNTISLTKRGFEQIEKFEEILIDGERAWLYKNY